MSQFLAIAKALVADIESVAEHDIDAIKAFFAKHNAAAAELAKAHRIARTEADKAEKIARLKAEVAALEAPAGE